MATANGSSGNARWVPPPGRHKVDVGGSLKRALRARKGMPAPTNKNMPMSDYYLFRYNFKPESVDTSKPGVVEVKRGKEATTVQVERPIVQSEDVHFFTGNEEPSKEVECVLIFDEETNTFTLEKLDSTLSLTHSKKGRSKARIPSASPLPNTPSPAASTSKALQEEDFDRELLDTWGGADVQPQPQPATSSQDFDEFEQLLESTIAPSKPAPKPKKAPAAKPAPKGKKAAAAAATEAAVALALPSSTSSTPLPAPPAPRKGKPKPKLKGSAAAESASSTPPPPNVVSTPTSSLPPTESPFPFKGKPKRKASTAAAAESATFTPPPAKAAASTPRLAASSTTKAKARVAPEPEPEPSGVDVEVIELDFGKPAKQTALVSPTDGLALPFSGGSAAFMPGPLASSSGSGSALQQQDDDDDDDDNWVAVAGVGAEASPVVSTVGAMDIPLDASSFGGGEIDQFAADLDQQLLEGLEGLEEDDGDGDGEDADDDMFGDNAYEQATAAAAAKGKPMSLNQFAGGGETGLDDQDDDDYSSSEESDDD